MIRKAVFFTLLTGFLIACSTTNKPKTPPGFVSWDKKMIELGDVKKGEKRSFFYEFTNTSGENIQIDIVDACECTKVDFPRGIIEPGKKGKLDVVFDSTEKNENETISINVIFKNKQANGVPQIQVVEYRFGLIK